MIGQAWTWNSLVEEDWHILAQEDWHELVPDASTQVFAAFAGAGFIQRSDYGVAGP